DVAEGKCRVRRTTGESQLRALAVTVDGKTVITAGHTGGWGGHLARFWDATTGLSQGDFPRLAGSRDVEGEALEPGEVLRRSTRRPKVWPMGSIVVNPPGVEALALAPDRNTLALTGYIYPSCILLWDLAAGHVAAMLCQENTSRALACSLSPRQEPLLA